MRRPTPLLAVSGPSGSGKTTLLTRLIPLLRERGLRVVAIKHAGHAHRFDTPGKDSARLRESGAEAVALLGPTELAWFGPPLPLGDIVRLLPPADLILCEGLRGERVPRIEVRRAAVGEPFLCATDPDVLAVVSDQGPPRALPWFELDDVRGVARFVERFARSAPAGVAHRLATSLRRVVAAASGGKAGARRAPGRSSPRWSRRSPARPTRGG
jgi:molybdopterin-guanine dinucleotide biosynthesis protein B